MLKPLADRIVVNPTTAEEMTKGGIVLPDTAKTRPQEGEVIAVGPGKVTENGVLVPVEITVGDKVMYSKYGGTEIKIGKDEYVILRQDDILAIIR